MAVDGDEDVTSECVRVLVVDDDPDVAESLADLLHTRACIVEIAANGLEAVRRAQDQSFDLIFMDQRMPGMNGIDSCRAIRRLDPKVRIVMMMSYGDAELEGVFGRTVSVLYKPMEIEVVLKLIEGASADAAVSLAA